MSPIANTLRARSAARAVLLPVLLVVGGLVLAPPTLAQPTDDDAPQPLPPARLTTEYLEAPMGLDTRVPRFGWWPRHEGRNVRQAAWQVQVARKAEDLESGGGLVWDSGRTEGADSFHVEYGGTPLATGTRYHWRVRYWDDQDAVSAWSTPAVFEMGLLSREDFSAGWVQGPVEMLPATYGCRTAPAARAGEEAWLEVDLGAPREVATVVLYPARVPGANASEVGHGFPETYTVSADGEPLANPLAGQPGPAAGAIALTMAPRPVHRIRIAASTLPQVADGQYALALAEVEVRDAAGNNVAAGARVNASSVDDAEGWALAHLTDSVRGSWEARWPSPRLRKAFTLEQPVAHARAYASGLGYYELLLNGTRVGDHQLDPAYTVHTKRTLYSTYDVTALLQEGENVAAMRLGQGWWPDAPAAWLQLHVTYVDGTETRVVTDTRWRWDTTGPLRWSSLYHGETYDARAETDGWATPGFDDSSWAACMPMETPPATLASQVMPPIRLTETRRPAGITERAPGRYIVDFGQNLTGWVQFTVEGAGGDEVLLRHAELLYEDGALNPENLRTARATDRYILRGGGQPETWRPRFTQHGFRYVEVHWPEPRLRFSDIEAQVVHTDLPQGGAFATTNELLQTITDITHWSIRGNSMSIPTDCPQRDERMGWLGDAHLAAETTLLQFNANAYYENWLRIIANAQDAQGRVPDTAPAAAFGQQDGSPPWAMAYPLLVHYLHQYNGNRRVVAEHYDNIVRWFGTLEGHAQDGIVDYGRYGDWVGVEETPMPLISTGVYYWTAQMLEGFARVLEKTEDAQRWAAKRDAIAEAFNTRFFDEAAGYYGNGSQFSQIFPLHLGIAQREDAARARLVQQIEEARGGHLATGILGTKYVFPVLDDMGRTDLAWQVVLQRGYPSWGYMIDNGATTLWELWEEQTGPGMNSHNHQMFGSVVDWFFHTVGGIGKPQLPGYSYVRIAPQLHPEVDSASTYLDTVRGRLSCTWARRRGGFVMTVDIPPSVRAKVVVPSLGLNLSARDPDLIPLEEYNDRLVFELGSGTYLFDFR